LVSPKKSNSVTINLLVDKGNDNFADPNTDPDLVQRMKDFLTNFATTYLSEFDLNLKIDAQTAEVEKLNREYNSIASDIEKLKKELSAKENSLSAKEAALNRAKDVLNELRK
jgi:chromosome segregation ATPase